MLVLLVRRIVLCVLFCRVQWPLVGIGLRAVPTAAATETATATAAAT